MQDPERVRARIDKPLALERNPIDLPILVMGRDDDHLQGIFRVSYDLLAAAGKQATWVSGTTAARLHLPGVRPRRHPQVDDVQERAIDGIMSSWTVTSAERPQPHRTPRTEPALPRTASPGTAPGPR